MGKKDALGLAIPHSDEAERMILGSLFAENQSALDAIDIIKPEHFYNPEFQTIFVSVRAVVAQCGKVDCLAVADHLKAERKLDAVGGIPFIASLSDGMPAKLNIGLWLQLLKKQAILRKFQKIIGTQQDKISGGGADALISETIEKLYEIDTEIADDPASETEVYASYMRGLESGPVFRIRTGIGNLDRVIGGFKPGELAIFTGGPGMGKSLVVGQLRTHACQAGYHSIFFSGEMKNERILSRRLTQETGIILSHVDSKNDLGIFQYKDLIEAGKKMCSTCRFEDSALTLGRIRRQTRILKRTHNISAVFVDYDELVEVEGVDENDEQRNLVRELKRLGMDLNIVVVLVSQLRKPVGDDGYVPTLQSVYGSGAKIKHASYVIFVHRKFVATLEGDKTTAIFAVLKNREGNIGAIKDVKFNIHYLKFEDWDGRENPE